MQRFFQRLDLVPFFFMTVFVVAAFFLPAQKLLLLFPDDSFFYMKTASHIARGMGSTFDGINFSNGYHPLYMYVLAALSLVWNLTGYDGLRAVLLLDGVLFLCFLYCLDRFLIKGRLAPVSRFLILMLCTILLGFYDFGNESRLLLPLAWLLVLCVTSDLRKQTWRLWGLGLVAAAVFLTRLDAVLWVGAIFFYLLIKNNGRQLVRLLTPLVLPLLLAGIGFILYNWLVFSSPATVSGYQKFGWPGVFATRWLITALPALQARFYFSLLMALGYLGWRRCNNPEHSCFTEIVYHLALYVCCYLCILVFWARGEVRFWYFVLPVSFSFVVLGLWLQQWSLAANIRFQTVLLLALLCFGGYTIHKKVTWETPVDAWKMALWIRDHTPDSARLYQVDGSGLTGYFSERAVINGDGLINSWEYQRFLRRGELSSYLALIKVDYLVWNRYQDHADIRINVPLKDAPGFEISVADSSRIMARFGRMIIIPMNAVQVSVKGTNHQVF